MHKTPQLNQKKVYQFKATLLRIEPPIWRRILVPREFSLNELHWIMQIAFGWTNDHLHEFVTPKGRRYGDPDFELSTFGEKRGNEYMTRLSGLNLTVKSKLIYEYDFGDSWEHLIEVEKVHLFDEDQQYPIVLGGERSGPPEDCGGAWGYQDLLDAIADPSDPYHEESLERVEEDFDPEYFDIDKANERLLRMFEDDSEDEDDEDEEDEGISPE